MLVYRTLSPFTGFHVAKGGKVRTRHPLLQEARDGMVSSVLLWQHADFSQLVRSAHLGPRVLCGNSSLRRAVRFRADACVRTNFTFSAEHRGQSRSASY